jgi:hypothetical protein
VLKVFLKIISISGHDRRRQMNSSCSNSNLTLPCSWISAVQKEQKQSHLLSQLTSVIKMRFSSYALPALAANSLAALPAPQEVDLDMVVAAPDPITFTEAVGVTAQTVTIDITAAAAQATARISPVVVDAGDFLSSTTVVQAKRAAATCVPH